MNFMLAPDSNIRTAWLCLREWILNLGRFTCLRMREKALNKVDFGKKFPLILQNTKFKWCLYIRHQLILILPLLVLEKVVDKRFSNDDFSYWIVRFCVSEQCSLWFCLGFLQTHERFWHVELIAVMTKQMPQLMVKIFPLGGATINNDTIHSIPFDAMLSMSMQPNIELCRDINHV